MNATQEGESGFINIKVKTLNHSLHDIIVNPLKPIRKCQTQIEQKTRVPISSQRLLYRGIVLDVEKTLADYRIEEGNIIQLIANKIPSEHSNHSSIKRSQINRTNNYSKEHSKTKKYRQLQERLNGFRVRREQSLQTLQQNKRTIDQLIECLSVNFMKDISPFKMDRRKLEVGQWVDVRDASGQWIQGQVINQYGDYVLIHFNGLHNRWNQWIPSGSERIMPFRTHTVQMMAKTPYLSPFPSYERQLPTKLNPNFRTNIQTLISDMTFTLDNLSTLVKDLEFNQKDFSNKEQSFKNVSNISVNNNICVNVMQQNQNENQGENYETFIKQEYETPSKQNPQVADNSSNICEDDRSNKEVNDDVSSKKSFKSKRSEGLVDTASMKSLIIDQSRKKQNKVYYDRTEEAQSVCSVYHKNKGRNLNTFNQEYILEEDSTYNQQEFQEANLLHKREMKRKMKASQLAPLLDRMGRFLIDMAPHFAVLGHTDQLSGSAYNQNLSTFTNEGSLLSKMSQINKFGPTSHQFVNSSNNIPTGREAVDENNEQERVINNFCSFQVPIMLTPHELLKLQKLIEAEKRNLHML